MSAVHAGAAPEPGGLLLLEQILNRLLELDEDTAARLEEIAGRIIAVELTGTGIAFELLAEAGAVRLRAVGSRTPDVIIRGRPSELLRHVTSRRGGGQIEISGDVELAQELQRIFAALDPDWEEALSQRIGDTPARALSRMSAALIRFVREARGSLAFSLSEYLRYERQALMDRPDVDAFVRAVDDLRDDAERLRARLQVINRRAGGDRPC